MDVAWRQTDNDTVRLNNSLSQYVNDPSPLVNVSPASLSALSQHEQMFRPCIDLHNGQVKQIVGGSLSDDQSSLRTNFVAS